MIPAVAAPARLEAKADEILKVHRDAAKVAKARALSPAFDAECREAERPVGFWQWAGYTVGWLRSLVGRQEKVPATRGLGKLLAALLIIGLSMAVSTWLLLLLFMLVFYVPHRNPYQSPRYRRY